MTFPFNSTHTAAFDKAQIGSEREHEFDHTDALSSAGKNREGICHSFPLAGLTCQLFFHNYSLGCIITGDGTDCGACPGDCDCRTVQPAKQHHFRIPKIGFDENGISNVDFIGKIAAVHRQHERKRDFQRRENAGTGITALPDFQRAFSLVNHAAFRFGNIRLAPIRENTREGFERRQFHDVFFLVKIFVWDYSSLIWMLLMMIII